MKSWEELTNTGRFRRLRHLALNALEQYSISPNRISLVGGFTNVIFRIDSQSGRFALRIDLQQEHSDSDVDVELAWLSHLARTTDLDVARFVSAADESPYVFAGAPGVPGERRCVLFEWIPGRPLFDRLSENGYERLGRLSAGLIESGRDFAPSVRPMAWDKVFYWPVEVDPIVVFEPRFASLLGDRRTILESSLSLATEAFSQFDPANAQVVHGDLHPWNVHSYYGRLIALDFEDVMWAHPVQDVAITLSYLRDEPEYPDLKAAFVQGFESVSPWPETYQGQLGHFMAARQLMMVNYVANLEPDPTEYWDYMFPRLKRYLATWG